MWTLTLVGGYFKISTKLCKDYNNFQSRHIFIFPTNYIYMFNCIFYHSRINDGFCMRLIISCSTVSFGLCDDNNKQTGYLPRTEILLRLPWTWKVYIFVLFPWWIDLLFALCTWCIDLLSHTNDGITLGWHMCQA